MHRGLLVVVALLSASPAVADPITYTFGGTVHINFLVATRDASGVFLGYEQDQAGLSYWFPDLLVGSTGQAFTGTFVYDADAVTGAGNQRALGGGSYGWHALHITVGSLSFDDGGNLNVLPASGVTDRLETIALVPSITSPVPAGGVHADDLLMTFVDPTGTALVDTETPLTLDGFSAGDFLFFAVLSQSPAQQANFDVTGTITHIERTPEPAAWLLVALGGLLIGTRRHLSGSKPVCSGSG